MKYKPNAGGTTLGGQFHNIIPQKYVRELLQQCPAGAILNIKPQLSTFHEITIPFTG
jgi:hypothetical protein